MLCEQHFFELYKREPQEVAFCPYRICPIGAHSDHQHGKVTGIAIDKGIYLAYSPKQNGISPEPLEVISPGCAQTLPCTRCLCRGGGMT